MSKSTLFCRFCAEEKPYTEITTLTSQENRESVIEKLSFFGIVFVDFSIKMLPETVCNSCHELIIVSYEFFSKVKNAQVVLRELCGLEVEIEIGPQDSVTSSMAVKEECEGYGEYLQDDNVSSFEDGTINAELLSKKSEILDAKDNNLSAVKQENCYNGEAHIILRGKTSSNSTRVLKPKRKLTWATYPWQCAICTTREASLNALREHCKVDHLKCAAYQCADCTDQFDSFQDFVLHARGHRKALRNYCEYCNIKMEESHPNIHLMDNSCTFCGDIFKNQITLNTHLKMYAAKTTGLLAFNLEILDLDDSDIHNWADYPTICQFCKLKVVDKDVLTDHCIEVHRKCFGNQCVDCDESVDCFKDFVEHVKRHRPRLRNICPYCNIDMGHLNLGHLAEHTISRHPCAVCGEIFPRKRDLRAHESIIDPSPLITPPKKRRKGPLTVTDLTCEVCGMIMKTPASLKAHLKTHMARKRDYTCDRCGKAYYTKGSLDAHHKIHENIMKEACKICHKTFLTMQRLKKHVKTHNLEMPFQCDECKRCFSSKDRLREHVKVHMDLMPFECQYCSKRFRHKSIMKTHENQHTGARPYSCNLCFMEFGNWSNCNKHMKRKHGTTLAKNVMTPHGKLALNPKTGKPDQLVMDHVVKEWSEKMLMGRKGKQECNSVAATGKLIV